MSWTYSGDPSKSQKDAARFAIGDTDSAKPLLQDEEITYLINESNGNNNLLMYTLFTHVAITFAKDIKKSLGPQAQDPTERLHFFEAQMNIYKQKLSQAGISIPNFAYPKVFHKGMQNNPPWNTGYPNV